MSFPPTNHLHLSLCQCLCHAHINLLTHQDYLLPIHTYYLYISLHTLSMYLYNLTSPTLSLYLPYPHTHSLYVYQSTYLSHSLPSTHTSIHILVPTFALSLSLSLCRYPSHISCSYLIYIQLWLDSLSLSLFLSLFLSPSVMLIFVYFVSLSISLFVICPFFLSTCFHINGISRFLHRLGILLSFVCLPTCISSQCLCLHSYAVFLSHPILLLQHSISL